MLQNTKLSYGYANDERLTVMLVSTRRRMSILGGGRGIAAVRLTTVFTPETTTLVRVGVIRLVVVLVTCLIQPGREKLHGLDGISHLLPLHPDSHVHAPDPAIPEAQVPCGPHWHCVQLVPQNLCFFKVHYNYVSVNIFDCRIPVQASGAISTNVIPSWALTTAIT